MGRTLIFFAASDLAWPANAPSASKQWDGRPQLNCIECARIGSCKADHYKQREASRMKVTLGDAFILWSSNFRPMQSNFPFMR